MDDFPPIDQLARRLAQMGALKPSEWSEFKRLEMSSIESERREDALMLYGRLPADDPAKQAMQSGLDDLRSWAARRVAQATSSGKPWLCFVSGAPGSGKSALMARLASERPGALMATADDFKERFKAGLAGWIGETPEPARSSLGRSVYIHRLTSMPSWEMVDEAIEQRRDLAVEMLGMNAAEDARSIRRALAKGYEVEVRHVGCSIEASIARATRRHFDQKERGEEGRWVGLGRAVGRQRAMLASFAALRELLLDTPVKMSLMENTHFEMEPIWASVDGGAPPVDRFATWSSDPALWREGANPAADACVLRLAEDGRWQVAAIERANEPFKGMWAFPGGFIKSEQWSGAFEWGAELAKDAAARRFYEETLCREPLGELALLGKYDSVDRDPRNIPGRWVESWVFVARMSSEALLAGGDAARSAKWLDVDAILEGGAPMAFDHAELLGQALALASIQEMGMHGESPCEERDIGARRRARP